MNYNTTRRQRLKHRRLSATAASLEMPLYERPQYVYWFDRSLHYKRTPIQTRPPRSCRGKSTFWGRASHICKNHHLHKIQARYLSRAAYRCFSLPSSVWGRQPSVYLGLGGPAVEGMRLKPDAILPQTDGHRKPPRSELSPRSSRC